MKNQVFMYNNARFFSNFKPLSDDEGENLSVEQKRKTYTPYDPDRAEPDIDPEDFKRMQGNIHKFS